MAPKSRWDDDEGEEDEQQQQQQKPLANHHPRAASSPDEHAAAAIAPGRRRKRPASDDDDDKDEQRAAAAAAAKDDRPAGPVALLDRALQEASEFRQRMREQEEEAAAAAAAAAAAGGGAGGAGGGATAAAHRPLRVGLAALEDEEAEDLEARARATAEQAASARRRREQQHQEQEGERGRRLHQPQEQQQQQQQTHRRQQQEQQQPIAAVGLDDLDEMDDSDEQGPAPPPPRQGGGETMAAAAPLPEPSPSPSEGDGGAEPELGPAPPPPAAAADGTALPLPLPSPSASDDEEGDGQQQPALAPAPAHRTTFESSDDDDEPTPPPPPAPPAAAAATAPAPPGPPAPASRPAAADPPVLPAASAARECRAVDAYEKLNRISEGTYGVVFRARDKRTGGVYALKRIKLDVGGAAAAQAGFPQTALREVGVLLALRHPNLVAVREVCVSSSAAAAPSANGSAATAAASAAAGSSSVFVVMEYVEHDLRHLLDRQRAGELPAFSTAQVKCLFAQLLSGLEHLHGRWVLHRDLKTSNLLYGSRGDLKICDMGLARPYASPLRAYTPTVATLWYRPVERLLGAEPYSTELDCWGAGCVLAELLRGEPLFQGRGEIDQIRRIFDTLGTPAEGEWPGWEALPGCQTLRFPPKPKGRLRELLPRASLAGGPTLSDSGYALLGGLLALDPARRLGAAEALAHPWFREPPLPTPRALMPQFPQQAQPGA